MVSGRPLIDPELPAAVHHPAVLVAEQLERPESVAGPPVRLVAVEDHRGVVGDSVPGADFGELLGVDIVADDLVLQVSLPVDPDRAGDVAHVVEQHVLVALDDPDLGVLQVFLDPVGRDQDLGVSVWLSHGVFLLLVNDRLLVGNLAAVS